MVVYNVWVCVLIYVCGYVLVPRVQKGEPRHLRLELQAIVNLMWVLGLNLGNQTRMANAVTLLCHPTVSLRTVLADQYYLSIAVARIYGTYAELAS